MGNEPTTDQSTHRRSLKQQTQVLNQAKQTVQQLSLYSHETEKFEQTNLLARVILYGHSHLVQFLKGLHKDMQKQVLREFQSIDWETTDLLYEDLVLRKNINKQNVKKIYYEQCKQLRNKYKQKVQNKQKYEECVKIGEQLLKNKKVAVLLFAGGTSSRFRNSQNNVVAKQFYKEEPSQKCLFQIAIQKIQQSIQKYENIQILVVQNSQNDRQIRQILNQHPSVRARKILQNQHPIVSLSGKICLKNDKIFQYFSSPKGCGDLANFTVGNQKLLQYFITNQIQYVCAIGVQNICAQIVDPYFIGILASDPNNASVAYKCTYPDNQNQNLKRVIYNPNTKSVQISDFQLLASSCTSSSLNTIKKSPVFTNSFVFRPLSLSKQSKSSKSLPINSRSSPYSLHPHICTYYNPSTSSFMAHQHCYFFQRQLPDLLMPCVCVGVMVDREREFVPIVTINGDKSWGDAYGHYLYRRGLRDRGNGNGNNGNDGNEDIEGWEDSRMSIRVSRKQ